MDDSNIRPKYDKWYLIYLRNWRSITFPCTLWCLYSWRWLTFIELHTFQTLIVMVQATSFNYSSILTKYIGWFSMNFPFFSKITVETNLEKEYARLILKRFVTCNYQNHSYFEICRLFKLISFELFFYLKCSRSLFHLWPLISWKSHFQNNKKKSYHKR